MQRTVQQPALWANVARLAVDELMAHDRRHDAGRTLAAFCRPYLEQHEAPEAAMLALEVPSEYRLFAFDLDDWEIRRQDFSAIHETALRAIADHASFTPGQRLLAEATPQQRAGPGSPSGVTVRRDASCPTSPGFRFPNSTSKESVPFFTTTEHATRNTRPTHLLDGKVSDHLCPR